MQHCFRAMQLYPCPSAVTLFLVHFHPQPALYRATSELSMTVSGRQAEKRSTTLQLVPRGVCRGIWKNSTLDSELVTFQFSHTLCGFWQTSSPAGKPTEARKAERKSERNQSDAMSRVEVQAKGRGWARPLLTASRKVQIKIQ